MARENNAPPQPQLPSDLVIYEILRWLPVKYLLRSKCVCKQWNSIISGTHFAKLHLFRSTMDPTLTHHRLLLYPESGYIFSCSVKSIFNKRLFSSESLDLRRDYNNIISGTCNGLVCLKDVDLNVRLWNPSTRLVSINSPSMDYDLGAYCIGSGLGYDHMSNRYKVVYVYTDCENGNIAKVYTFGDSFWKTINMSFLLSASHRVGKFVGGSLNWVIKAEDVTLYDWVILCFDLEKEEFKELLLPDFGDDNPIYSSKPAVLKDCLCVCYHHRTTDDMTVWLMREYGVKESWVKFMVIPRFKEFQSLSYIEPLCMSENDMVLLHISDDSNITMVYNPKEDRLEYPKICETSLTYPWFPKLVYVESLVSPCF